jgi:hypothetical protein
LLRTMVYSLFLASTPELFGEKDVMST